MNHIMSKGIRLRHGVLLGLLSAALAGCSGDLEDLHNYSAEIKAREASGIRPLPEVQPYVHFEYRAENLRNPFDASVLAPQALAQTEAAPVASAVSPDANRTPEFLENYPLDTLRMVGSLAQNGELWALIQTPDDVIQRVSEGDYIGQNYGRIQQVTQSEVGLVEIVPNGIGGWMEREASVALSDASAKP